MRLNRRVPNGTHGGVRGRGLFSPSYSIIVLYDVIINIVIILYIIVIVNTSSIFACFAICSQRYILEARAWYPTRTLPAYWAGSVLISFIYCLWLSKYASNSSMISIMASGR